MTGRNTRWELEDLEEAIRTQEADLIPRPLSALTLERKEKLDKAGQVGWLKDVLPSFSLLGNPHLPQYLSLHPALEEAPTTS